MEIINYADDHPIEIRQDFRRFYGISYEGIGEDYTWTEGYYLWKGLSAYTDSTTRATIEGWDYPLDPTSHLLIELYDLVNFRTFNGKKSERHKIKPFPRPWDRIENSEDSGSVAHLTDEEKQAHTEANLKLFEAIRSGEFSTKYTAKTITREQ